MTRPPLSRRARRIAAIALSGLWMAVIFGFSSLPGSAVPGRFGPIGHFVLYAVLASAYLAALDPALTSPRAAIVAVALASIYGISDEYHQRFVAGRMCDPADWVVDTLGALVAVGVVLLVARRRRGRGSPQHPA